MTVFSTTHAVSEAVQPRYVFKWLWLRLKIYLAAAVASAIFFFAGAFLYAQLTTEAPSPKPASEQKTFKPQSQPVSPPAGDLIVKLPSGEELPFASLYKRVVEDKAGQPVGLVVGFSPQSSGQAIIVSVQTGGLNKTVGIPTEAFSRAEPRDSIQANLPRETIVTSPTFANIGGVWQRAD